MKKLLFINFIWCFILFFTVANLYEISLIKESVITRHLSAAFSVYVNNEGLDKNKNLDKMNYLFMNQIKIYKCTLTKDKDKFLYKFTLRNNLTDEVNNINSLLRERFYNLDENYSSYMKCNY